jgi:hypothetical protein
LETLPTNCPNQLFADGPRASSFVLPSKSPAAHLTTHACIQLAVQALKRRNFRSAHEDVEMYMLEEDVATVATEVPVWLDSEEMRRLGLSGVEGCLTGHIDILRFEVGSKIGIWDFKPAAEREESAHVQVALYALMLATRTGIPLSEFECGFFDEKDAFAFSAEEFWRERNF